MSKEELLLFYQENMYGIWRDGEQVSFEKNENGYNIHLKKCGRTASFPVTVKLPEKDAPQFEGGCPFIVCMHPIPGEAYALQQGYAVLIVDSYKVASDDYEHKGAFYELYPYEEEQTGVLMAWAWGTSKVLDAVLGGLDSILHLNASASLVTGVSRWGKATAVGGAFDHRFRMVIPACSGAGGLALYDVTSKGNTYDFTAIGGPCDYTYGENEPLSCLQSDGEKGWFCDRFLQYETPDAIPVSQSMLPVLAAEPDRYYFIVAACMKEDWVNAPSMWECFKRAEEEYKAMGLSDHIVEHFHAEGHAVLEEDMKLIIEYFNHKIFGHELTLDPQELKTSVFERPENK